MSKLTAYDKFIQQALKYGFSLFGLPPTGQTTVFQANDDGTYQKGYPRTGPHFTDNDDGTVTDNATGLMWVKNINAIGRATSWSDGIAKAEACTIGGHTDWRLPNVKELMSIIDYSKFNPMVAGSFFSPFTGTYTENFWSSTTYRQITANAWYVTSNFGVVQHTSKTYNGNPVLPVRLGYPPA